MSEKIRILVVGCGNMGRSHALAYHQMDGFEICGIVSRGTSKEKLNEALKKIHSQDPTVTIKYSKEQKQQIEDYY